MDYPIKIVDQLTPQLRSLRRARGLSQAELASRLGVTQSRVAAIEARPAAVGVGQLLQILDLLGAELVLRDRQPSAAAPVAVRRDSSQSGEW